MTVRTATLAVFFPMLARFAASGAFGKPRNMPATVVPATNSKCSLDLGV